MAENGHEEPGSSFVRITNREIYDGLTGVQAEIKDLKLQMMIVMKENVDIKKEYGNRIRSLELRFYGVLAGLIAALTSLGVGLGVGGL